jgi:spermidine synthase
LLAGAGTGNDAAGCLRNGAEEVTAVEIDPAIVAMGKQFHPEKPYADRRVSVVIDDARSQFATARGPYDLIVFCLLDAHTTAAMANARLDHFVYTRESFKQVHRLLAPDGLLVVSFAATKLYIVDRLAGTLRTEFDKDPLVFLVPHNNYGFGAVMFVTGNLDMARERIAEQPQLAELVRKWSNEWTPEREISYRTEIATDDWPYLYLEYRCIPILMLVMTALVFLVLGVVRRVFDFPPLVQGWERMHIHFASLGAAFLLLEVQNISRAAVVLGNTWLVSAVVITGVLCMILLANLLVYLRPNLSTTPFFVALLASCLALYFIDLAQFASYPFAVKLLVVGGLTTLPMLFSGVIFIRSLKETARKDDALGANLIGSLAGGLLQAITYLTGTRALLLLVALIYAIALLFAPKGGVASGTQTA